MNRLSFLLVSMIGIITSTFNTNCMLLALHKIKGPLLLPHQQKRFCLKPILVDQRLDFLEKKVELQANELARIKAIVGRWNNNHRAYDPYANELLLSKSFIDEHNMHYGNK